MKRNEDKTEQAEALSILLFAAFIGMFVSNGYYGIAAFLATIICARRK